MRILRLLAATATLVTVPATAALAHPAFNPNAIPVGESVESTLVVPHGCAPGGGMPDGEAVPTVQLDLGSTDQVSIEPGEVDGWAIEDDGEAIVWRDTGGATTEPIELPVTITVVEGAEGDQLFLPAFQQCEDGSSFRWVATPGQDGDPAVKLELTSGGTGTVDVDDGDHDTSSLDGMDDSEAPDDLDANESMTATENDPGEASPAADAAAMGDASGSSGTMVLVAAVVVAVALLVGVVAFRKRGSA